MPRSKRFLSYANFGLSASAVSCTVCAVMLFFLQLCKNKQNMRGACDAAFFAFLCSVIAFFFCFAIKEAVGAGEENLLQEQGKILIDQGFELDERGKEIVMLQIFDIINQVYIVTILNKMLDKKEQDRDKNEKTLDQIRGVIKETDSENANILFKAIGALVVSAKKGSNCPNNKLTEIGLVQNTLKSLQSAST